MPATPPPPLHAHADSGGDVPLLFDLQVNGFAGVDFQQEGLALADLRRAVDALRLHQTGRILLTLISDHVDALCWKFEHLERLRGLDPVIKEMVCGYHLEGPFLSPLEGFVGAHRGDVQQAPEYAAFQRMQEAAGGMIRLITLAPEWEGSPEFIEQVTSTSVVVSLGHTDASETQIDKAIRAGASLCTHLGNGVPQVLPRHDNVIQRLLARDELTACFIPDGVHLPPFVFRNLVRAKPPGRVLLTTDAMAAAGAPPGRYQLGNAEVESFNGMVRQPGRANLAGSCLTPDQGVINAARWLGIPLAEARVLFSTRVAEVFHLPAE